LELDVKQENAPEKIQDAQLSLLASPLAAKKELRLFTKKIFVLELNITSVKSHAVSQLDLSLTGKPGASVFTTVLTKTAQVNRSDVSQLGSIQTQNKFVQLKIMRSDPVAQQKNLIILLSPGASVPPPLNVFRLNEHTIFVLVMITLSLVLATSDGLTTQCGLSASQSASHMIDNIFALVLDLDHERTSVDVCQTNSNPFHVVSRLNWLLKLI
jgi:hypothetical protein